MLLSHCQVIVEILQNPKIRLAFSEIQVLLMQLARIELDIGL